MSERVSAPGFVLLRHPLLPLSQFEQWRLSADQEQHVLGLYERPWLEEALYVSSPSLHARLLELLILSSPGLVHSIDESSADFRTLQLEGSRNLQFFGDGSGTRSFRRSVDGEVSAEPVKRPYVTLRDPTTERMQSIALVKPLSDVSQVEILPIAFDGLRVYRGPEFIERHVTAFQLLHDAFQLPQRVLERQCVRCR